MDGDKIKKKIVDVVDVAAQPAMEIVSSMLLEGMIGTLVPGAASVMLGCRQKRQERMFESFVIEIKLRQDELEEKILKLDTESRKKFTTDYFGIVIDAVLEEVQEEKIKYIADGFIYLASIPNAKEDLVLIYYDVLNSLKVVDLRFLKFYNNPTTSSRIIFQNEMDELGIKKDQIEIINSKLLNLGLLANKTEENISSIYKHLKDPTNKRNSALDPLGDVESSFRGTLCVSIVVIRN